MFLCTITDFEMHPSVGIAYEDEPRTRQRAALDWEDWVDGVDWVDSECPLTAWYNRPARGRTVSTGMAEARLRVEVVRALVKHLDGE